MQMRADQLLVERGLAASRSQAQRLIASGVRWLGAGGFTDCLLQHGAAQVTGVDVGHGQLHATLRADPRVVALEKRNARELSSDEVGRDFDLVVGDLSFISLTLVLPALAPLLQPGGDLLMLVKPQFELQPGQIGKGGIVTDPKLYEAVEQRLRDACARSSLQVRGWHDSPILGGDGNREFFVHATPVAHRPNP